MEYVGTRWYKCDFHLHTMQSECYKEKSDKVSDWIKRVKSTGLDCIAITDHNDYRAIDEIKEAAEKENIVVFPGVEVTCDTSKIHVLILFDVDEDGDKVRDFLSKLDIDKAVIGKSEGTIKSIFDVCKLAKEKGGLVIAAHIDEYSGINKIGAENLMKILSKEYLDAVQVVNSKVWEEYRIKKDENLMYTSLKEKYQDLSEEEMEKWRKTYEKALKSDLPIVEFSDNPCDDKSSKHGLWGIGGMYTWIKMDTNPTLESIRQALLSEDMRVKVCSESSHVPEQLPDMWIKSLSIKDSLLSPYSTLAVNFNPQLNSIIGGRGSGKSAIIRLLTGGLQANDMLMGEIKKEQENFYKEGKKGEGVFTNKTLLEICIYRNDILYKIVIDTIKSMDNQARKLYKQNESGEWEEVKDIHYLDFLQIQSYTQKQIFEIAKESDALLKIIDEAIEGIEDAKREKEKAYDDLLAKAAEIRNLEATISSEGKLRSELKDITEQIENYKKSGIAGIINNKQQFQAEEKKILGYINENERILEALDSMIESMTLPDKVEIEGKDELNKLISNHNHNIINSFNEIGTRRMKKMKNHI